MLEAFDAVFDLIRQRGVVVGDTDVEAHHNTYLLGADRAVAEALTVDDVLEFLSRARRLLRERADEPHGQLRFYSWFDEMAGHLCLSVTSAIDLPFSSPIRVTADAGVIVRQFLESDYLGGIPWSELSETDHSADVEPPIAQEPLDVYAVDLS